MSGQLFAAIPVAGLVSFASPCVLPLVPGYLGYIGGAAGRLGTTETATHAGGAVGSENSEPNSQQQQRSYRGRLLLGVTLFVLGFAAVFVAYGAAFGAVGSWLLHWQDLIMRILGFVVILMGLVFVGQLPFLQRTITPAWKPATGLGGAPLLGIVFGLGWTPCFGPTLIAIQALSLNSGSPWRGALLGLFYCLGLGVPFLLVALGFDWVAGTMQFLRAHIRTINIAGGVLLIGIGILMVTGLWTAWITTLQGVVFSFVPAL
jgi:cytochrome c-type biogenesis protein